MRPEHKRILVRVVDLVLVLLLLAFIIVTVDRVHRLRQHAASAMKALGQIEALLTGKDTALVQFLQDPSQMTNLQNTVDGLDADLGAIKDLAAPLLPLCPYLGWLPRIGDDLAAAPLLLDIAQHTIEAIQTTTQALTPLVQSLNKPETGLRDLGPELVQRLSTARSQLESAQDALSRAAESRSAVDANKLSPQTQGIVEQLDRYLPLMDDGLRILTVLPGLLGNQDPRAYLILAQNNQELRATGGFISGVGLVLIESGTVVEMRFQDSYTVDDLNQPHPPPPAPLRQHMGAGMLMLRDANWWPDFPYSAGIIAELYYQDQGQAVDGIIAVDLEAMRLLVQALGPIQLPGYDQVVNSRNLQSMIMIYWEAPRLSAPGKEGSDWQLHRKDFAADLMSGLLTRLMEHASPKNLIALAKVLGTALRERHLSIFVTESGGQAILRSLDWDGALRPAAGDYLMIVDTNVGFNKVNPNIALTVDYHVTLGETGSATAQLGLSYRHTVEHPTPACIHESHYGDTYADLLERCYWNYLRIYVPEGSQLVQIIGADAPTKVYAEAGRTVFATSFLLEPGQARQLQVSYSPNLPQDTKQYALLVQKQPGTGENPLRVTITPPKGTDPSSASPTGSVWLDGQMVWQGDLVQDREIRLSWE